VYRENIRAIYEHLSPGYRRIADFLLSSYQDAAFMTAAEVARASHVDTALVVRFAQRLGYPGYPELITDVQEDVKRDLRAVYEPAEGDNSPAQVFRRNLLQDRNSLEYMLLHLDESAIQQVVELLARARRIFVAGEGNTNFLAEAFAMRLLSLGFPAHALSGELAGHAALAASIQPDDVFVGLGTTAMTPGVAVLFKVLRDAGATTIGIMGALTNPGAGVAEFVLHAPVDTMGLMPSWTAIAAVLHGLSQALAIHRGEPAADWVMRTDHYLSTYAELLRHQLVGAREAIGTYKSRLM
jgi:DNA-binding MurR/RpiR family transcriptional regulator